MTRRTRNASLAETNPFIASDPAALCRPTVSKLSFTIIGTQWSGPTGPDAAHATIEIVCLLKRVGIDLDQRVERRSLLVVRIDSAQVLVYQRMARQALRRQFRLDAGDGCFLHFKRGRGLARSRNEGQRYRDGEDESWDGHRGNGTPGARPVVHSPHHGGCECTEHRIWQTVFARFAGTRFKSRRIFPLIKYGFQAAPDVKSVGSLLAHVALSPGWQIEVHRQRISAIDFAFFAGRAPQIAADERALETKDQILEALKRGGEEFASMVERMTPELLAETVSFAPPLQPPQKTRFEMLLGVKEHEMHHRGQLMLIERILGIVPHLTRRRQAFAAGTRS